MLSKFSAGRDDLLSNVSKVLTQNIAVDVSTNSVPLWLCHSVHVVAVALLSDTVSQLVREGLEQSQQWDHSVPVLASSVALRSCYYTHQCCPLLSIHIHICL